MSMQLINYKNKVLKQTELKDLLREINKFDSYNVLKYFNHEPHFKNLINQKIIKPLEEKLLTFNDIETIENGLLQKLLEDYITQNIPPQHKDNFRKSPYYNRGFRNYKQKIKDEMPEIVINAIKENLTEILGKAIKKLEFIEENYAEPREPVVTKSLIKIKIPENRTEEEEEPPRQRIRTDNYAGCGRGIEDKP